MPTRRIFILGSAAAAVAVTSGVYLGRAQPRGTLLSAFEDERGDQYVGGVSLVDGKIFGVRVPLRAHGCAVDPADPQRVLFFARRPGTVAFELRLDTLQMREAFATQPGRHLAGHGVFSSDGTLIFTPEHDYERVRGLAVVRDARTFAVLDEIDTRGIDPHEVAWLPDQRSLLVANGGIMTHPRSFRRKLNIPTMDPSLCVIDAGSGECREQWRLPDHRLSIRHLAVANDGSAAVGLQYEGSPGQAPGIAAIYRPQSGLQLLTAPPEARAEFRDYVASVALSEESGLIAAACPYGNGVACWSLRDGSYAGFMQAGETYGLSRLKDGAIVASQRDGTAYRLGRSQRPRSLRLQHAMPIRWDDHWVALSHG